VTVALMWPMLRSSVDNYPCCESLFYIGQSCQFEPLCEKCSQSCGQGVSLSFSLVSHYDSQCASRRFVCNVVLK
jgi:hypothetical protein